ncbi:MAG: hypothetical protein UV80_C0002G0310 [Candidatus Peregrinibacteria bacterium GW2011_GWF2_43_17]|nr:MAG: hypothetical protein UV80_C0002G0310 [Candidatus Peregrinibacteria bacterium GW2011_GWF2_43_17]HAU39648.1 hypothetical protein [Candidatus Peregrinibacteria bacterium]
MKKIIILAILITMLTPAVTFAASTLLPEGTEDCTKTEEELSKLTIEDQKELMKTDVRDGILGCAIQTGNIHLWMLPYYITYIIEFLMNIAGLISVLFVIIGGYLYAWGGLTEDKEKGKKTVMYALIGLTLSTLGWIIVNIIQVQLTS